MECQSLTTFHRHPLFLFLTLSCHCSPLCSLNWELCPREQLCKEYQNSLSPFPEKHGGIFHTPSSWPDDMPFMGWLPFLIPETVSPNDLLHLSPCFGSAFRRTFTNQNLAQFALWIPLSITCFTGQHIAFLSPWTVPLGLIVWLCHKEDNFFSCLPSIAYLLLRLSLSKSYPVRFAWE